MKELGNYCELLKATEANCLKGGLAAVSKAEFETAMNNGTWAGGLVEGMGYVAGIVNVIGGTGGMVANAKAELNVTASPGTANNPEVQKYYTSVGGYSSNTPDSTPWCSAFVNWDCNKSGIAGTGDASAKSWLNWGYPTSNPQPGDIAVAPDGSHVGVVESVINGEIMISGNYTHSVKRSDCSGYIFRTAHQYSSTSVD